MPSYIQYQDPGQAIQRQQNRRDEKFRDMLNMMMLAKQMNQQQEQQGWERQQAEQKMAMEQEQMGYMKPYYEKRTEEMGRPQTYAPPEKAKMVEWMIQNNIVKTYQEGMEKLATFGQKTPEQIQTEADARAKGAGTGKYKPGGAAPKVTQRHKQDKELLGKLE